MEEEKNITAGAAEENVVSADDASDYYNGDDDNGDDFSQSEAAPVKEEAKDNATDEAPLKRKREKIKIDRNTLKTIRNTAIITVSAIFLIFAILFITASALNPSDRVARNIWVGSVNVSGKTYAETLKAIEGSDSMHNQQILLKCGDNYYGFSGGDVEARINPEETAKLAFNYGKSGNFFKDGISAMRVLFTKYTLAPSSSLNEDLLAVVLTRFGGDMYGTLAQHSVEFNETSAIVTPGHSGFDGDVTKALSEVKDAFGKAIYNPVKVTLKSASPDDFTVETFDHICYKDPVDAHFEINGTEITVVAEENGRYLNKDEVKPYLSQIKEGGEKVTVPIYLSYPSVTAETLRGKLFNATLASYSTNYGSSTANRAANVARSASLINGKILNSGEVFSFNDTVGPRTKENGFYPATEYVAGKSVEGIGGGTCQVSTTLYSAVLYADLNIVSRTNHMMTIGYAPLGQDATVAYNSVDFKFRNSTDYPIKIQATANGSTLTVSIIGTAWEPAREVKLSHSTSKSGENTIVNSVRYVYSNGQLISTDTLGRSVYQPHKSDTPSEQPAASGSSSSASSESSSSNSSGSGTSSASSSNSSAEDDESSSSSGEGSSSQNRGSQTPSDSSAKDLEEE